MAVKPILLDTNAYIAFKNNQTQAIEVIRNVRIIGINTIIIGELLGGLMVGSKSDFNRQQLQQFLDSPRIKIFSIDQQTSEYYALIYFQLRKKGRPIPTNDMWIAATAMQHDLSLFTYDNDFKPIDGLKQGNFLTDFID